MWTRPGNQYVLNDNAMCTDGRDWLGTFHGAKKGDWNGGVANVVFVDGHVGSVKSGLQTTDAKTADLTTAEKGYERFCYPRKGRI